MDAATLGAPLGVWEQISNLLPFMALALFWLVLVCAAWWALDRWYFRSWDLGEQLREGNVAAAIFAVGVIFSMFYFASHASGATDRYDPQFRRAWRAQFGTTYPWQWGKAQGMAESGLRPRVCSPVGACGIMQIMPGTARELRVNPYHAPAAIHAGIRYMRRLWGIYQADRTPLDRLRFAQASYNWGAGNVIRVAQPRAKAAGRNENSWAGIVGFLPEETRHYSPRIHRWCDRFRGAPCWTG